MTKAYDIAVQEGSGVLVEHSVSGIEHRLLIVGGRLVAANRSDFITVVGDGRQTVQALVDSQVNCDPRRGPTELHPLSVVRIDTAAAIELERQGLGAAAVPAPGRVVLIQRNANHAFDCTDEVHPETIGAAALAARVVGLDIAGIDLVCEDISKPLSAQHGALVEVNAGPGLLMHIKPGEGKTRPVGEAIVANLFAPQENGRIPLVGVSGTQGRTAASRLIAHMLCLAGKCTGLAYDRCSVGVVTHIGSNDEDLSGWDVQPTGSEYYTTPRAIYRTQVDVVLPTGHAVLNADNDAVVELAHLCDGKVIFFARDRRNAVLQAHLSEGERGVFIADGQFALARGKDEARLCGVAQVPLISLDERPGGVAAVLAAVATGWALGLTDEVIRIGIQTYGLDLPEPAASRI